jgi:hypothetical protein
MIVSGQLLNETVATVSGALVKGANNRSRFHGLNRLGCLILTLPA